MLSFIWSSLSNWDRADLLGLLMVVVGVAGEWVITFPWVKDKLKIPYNPTNFPALEFKKLLLEVFFTGFVAVGVGLELSAWPQHVEEIRSLDNSNLALQKEILRLKNPNIITEEQRKRFIAILSSAHNVSKIHVEVIVGNCDRQTEQFAFQIRKILNEAGYGDVPDKAPTTNSIVSSIHVESVPQPKDLPPFTWADVSLTKIPNFNISPLPISGGNNSHDSAPRGALLASEIPFTDQEPDIIALFSQDAPPPPSTLPSVMFFYPTENSSDRGAHVSYAQNDHPDPIIYGLAEVFKEIGITVGVNTSKGVLSPGHVAFYIPGR